MTRRNHLLTGLVALFALVYATPAWALDCYPDADGDGYKAGTATAAASGATTCPSGSTTTAPATTQADCDDTDNTVHPGVTDPAKDCDDATDPAAGGADADDPAAVREATVSACLATCGPEAAVWQRIADQYDACLEANGEWTDCTCVPGAAFSAADTVTWNGRRFEPNGLASERSARRKADIAIDARNDDQDDLLYRGADHTGTQDAPAEGTVLGRTAELETRVTGHDTVLVGEGGTTDAPAEGSVLDDIDELQDESKRDARLLYAGNSGTGTERNPASGTVISVLSSHDVSITQTEADLYTGRNDDGSVGHGTREDPARGTVSDRVSRALVLRISATAVGAWNTPRGLVDSNDDWILQVRGPGHGGLGLGIEFGLPAVRPVTPIFGILSEYVGESTAYEVEEHSAAFGITAMAYAGARWQMADPVALSVFGAPYGLHTTAFGQVVGHRVPSIGGAVAIGEGPAKFVLRAYGGHEFSQFEVSDELAESTGATAGLDRASGGYVTGNLGVEVEF